jgi:hypothetical protein
MLDVKVECGLGGVRQNERGEDQNSRMAESHVKSLTSVLRRPLIYMTYVS